MSSHNSFYRYRVESPLDISPDTWARRKKKSEQNNKTSFFYEITEDFENFENLQKFIMRHCREQDAILTGLKAYKILIPRDFTNSYIQIFTLTDLADFLKYYEENSALIYQILLTPKTTTELKSFVDFYKAFSERLKIYWRFQPYDENLPRSITVADINGFDIRYNTIPGLEIHNTKAPVHYELEPSTQDSYSIKWQFSVEGSMPKLSVIIPTYNNLLFLSNVLWHLVRQKFPAGEFEVIIADDGSSDNSAEALCSLFEAYRDKVNITYIYWSKVNAKLGDQHFFRSGLARNLAARYSRGEYLVFLDSDMIVPENFVSVSIESLQNNDLIQFQRFHIHQEISKKNPNYAQININSDTYIEEKNYWSQLFFCNNWQDLPHFWKYTCTYALGLRRESFYKMGMFKKYYISYGFEDTDLGYELFKRNMKFSLVKTPLLHLTAYDQQQYKNSASKRVKLLKVTAELFFLQHLDKEIYYLLGDYFRMQKPAKSFFRDLLN